MLDIVSENPMAEDSDIEYVIYTRKSTEESSNKQVQSIPTQISACLKYAQDHGLKIMRMPEQYREFFQSEKETFMEDSSESASSKELFKQSRDLFIIKEQETGKEPWKRKKWRKLIELVESGKVRGILSYSPDRQSRNILEWGEIINFIDQGKLSLKYTNFHFEPNASGKMMLGIWFVFSKQYSDKLQEDTLRGSRKAHEDGKALGYHKHGYRINEQWYHEPDPDGFPLIRRAFEMKFDEWKKDTDILQYLNRMGYQKKGREGEGAKISKNAIGQLWRDVFYAGTFVWGDSEVDLAEKNPYYKPMITRGELFRLNLMLQGKAKHTPDEKKKKYQEIRPFNDDMLINSETWEAEFTTMLPNIKRFEKKIAAGEYRSLADAVKPSQIDIRCMDKKSPNYGFTIKADRLIEETAKFLETIRISDEDYRWYVEYAQAKMFAEGKTYVEKTRSVRLRYNKTMSEKEAFISKNLWKNRDEDEQKIYERKKREYDLVLSSLKKELDQEDEAQNETIEDYENFVSMLRDAASYYRKGSYVQKRKLSEIFILNIKISRSGLTVEPKPELRDMFRTEWLPEQDSNLWPTG